MLSFRLVIQTATLLVLALLAACDSEAPNVVPQASDAQFAMPEDTTSFSERVLASDPDATSLQFRIMSSPGHGTAEMNPATGEFVYVPQSDYFGPDSFTFTANDGKANSPPAVVALTMTPVPDAPRVEPVLPRMSDPDEYPTRIPLSIVDPDGDKITIQAESDNSPVARVQVDEANDTLLVSPHEPGTAGITVRISDGRYVETQTFEFSSLEVETTRNLALAAPNESALVLTNVADFDVSFLLDVNNHMYPGNRSESLRRILDAPTSKANAPAPYRIWKAIAENTRRGATLTVDPWAHGPVRLMSSLGFGYCDDVASAFASLARRSGLQARVWTLGGHVVPEVLMNERWEMYDPDVGVIYHNPDGTIAGVEDLVANPTLITNPVDPVLAKKIDARGPYSQDLADIYATPADNLVYDYYSLPTQVVDSTFTLPAGATLTLGGYWSSPLVDAPTGNVIPFAAEARLEMPAGWVGSLPTAFVVTEVQGTGAFKLDDIEYEIGSEELLERLADFDTAQVAPEISRSDGPVLVTILINAWAGAFQNSNAVMLSGLNVGAIELAEAKLPETYRLAPASYGQ
jgi:hypothetical protein